MPGTISRLRRKRKKDKKQKSEAKTVDDEMDEIDLLMEQQQAKSAGKLVSPKSVSKSGQPIITAFDGGDYNPSVMKSSDGLDPVSQDQTPKGGNVGNKKRSVMLLKEAPAAKDAAFSGPPRYDWIDIVSDSLESIHFCQQYFTIFILFNFITMIT